MVLSKNNVVIINIANNAISIAAILFIISIFLSLILLRNLFTIDDSVNHQVIAPNNTPIINISTSSRSEVLSNTLKPANTAAKTNKVIGFDIVRANVEKNHQ